MIARMLTTSRMLRRRLFTVLIALAPNTHERKTPSKQTSRHECSESFHQLVFLTITQTSIRWHTTRSIVLFAPITDQFHERAAVSTRPSHELSIPPPDHTIQIESSYDAVILLPRLSASLTLTPAPSRAQAIGAHNEPHVLASEQDAPNVMCPKHSYAQLVSSILDIARRVQVPYILVVLSHVGENAGGFGDLDAPQMEFKTRRPGGFTALSRAPTMIHAVVERLSTATQCLVTISPIHSSRGVRGHSS